MEIIFQSFWTYLGTLFLVITSGYSLAIAFYWLGVAISKTESKESKPSSEGNFFSRKYGN